MERLRCAVERITFQSEETGFTVLRCRAGGFQDLITVVGNMPEIHAGSILQLEGEWRMDSKYGRQFSVSAFEETLPATVYGIEKYLGSGLVKGIGPKYAHRIVQAFGAETLDVIEENPERLLEVPGIGKLRVERIRKSWAEQKEIRNIMLFLQSHDVSTGHATKIYKTYGAESIRVVTDNPYRLADEIWGIGFRTADTIAQKLGFERTRKERLQSGIKYTLNRLADEGHCFATEEQLLRTGEEMLEVEPAMLESVLRGMTESGDLITEEFNADNGIPERAIYLPPFYHAEMGTAKRLRELFQGRPSVAVRPEGLEMRIQRRTGIQYDEVQLQAIRTAADSKVLVLTGGPGTGKTTTTQGIIAAFRESGARILLAAPTGRAAKRLSEATGMEAKTIHRLLEMKPPEGYQRNAENPLEGDVLIVDECSMIDIMLMYSLLRALPDSMTLILVGDVDQLPSVGAGNVLSDVILSGAFPVIRLTRIFRQAQTSRIIMNAHRINAGEMPDLSNGRDTDFFFIDVEKEMKGKGLDTSEAGGVAEEAAHTVLELVQQRLPRHFRVPPGEIQVLTPMQRGPAGAANLNLLLQEAVNPGEDGLRRGGIRYGKNDKVMQIRNNYEKEVFNGDIGFVQAVNQEDRSLTVNFDGREVSYDVTELDELVLAYATTIHKAQGSEYPVVVMPVLMSHYMMLQRNLIYTGVTRAKRGAVVVGTRKALAVAIRNVNIRRRNTRLAFRLGTAGKEESGG